MSAFRKASKSKSKLRMALIGPSGSGKTFTALRIAHHLGSRIAVIDTEHGSASKYAAPSPDHRTPESGKLGEDCFDFDVLELGIFDPRNYIEAIQAAESEGYDVIVIDSLSHAWMGRGGVLELADNAKDRYRGNSFAGWKDATPLHNALIDAMVRCKAHLIATMRSKVEYVIQQGPRGAEPVKIGTAPVQRDGMDFEFDIAADMTLKHQMIVTKTRCRALDGKVIDQPGRNVAEVLKAWLSDGEPAPASQGAGGGPALIPPGTVAELSDLIERTRMSPEQVRAMLTKRGVTTLDALMPSDAEAIISRLKNSLGLYPFQVGGDSPILGVPSMAPDAIAEREAAVEAVETTAPTAGTPDQLDASNPEPDTSHDGTTGDSDSDSGDGSADDYVIGDATRPDRSEPEESGDDGKGKVNGKSRRGGRKDAGAPVPAAS